MIKKTLIVLFLACISSLSFSQKNRHINHEERSGFLYAPRNCDNLGVISQTIPKIASTTNLNASPDEPENLDALGLPESSTLATNTLNPPTKKEMVYDEFDRLIQVKIGDKIYKYAYDYRGRRIVVDETEAGGKYITITYSDGNAVLESKADSPNAQPKIKRLYHRGPDMGGGVGGINYTTDANGNNPIYYHYNSRGDVVMKTDQNNNVVWAATYEGFGKSTATINNGDDGARQRSNTKETDPTGFINEGLRYRDPELGIFLTPDPLEYIDGLNPYIYCSQNPWTKWDPEGLFWNSKSDTKMRLQYSIGDKTSVTTIRSVKEFITVFKDIAESGNKISKLNITAHGNENGEIFLGNQNDNTGNESSLITGDKNLRNDSNLLNLNSDKGVELLKGAIETTASIEIDVCNGASEKGVASAIKSALPDSEVRGYEGNARIPFGNFAFKSYTLPVIDPLLGNPRGRVLDVQKNDLNNSTNAQNNENRNSSKNKETSKNNIKNEN